jgi:hypothetical protein
MSPEEIAAIEKTGEPRRLAGNTYHVDESERRRQRDLALRGPEGRPSRDRDDHRGGGV